MTVNLLINTTQQKRGQKAEQSLQHKLQRTLSSSSINIYIYIFPLLSSVLILQSHILLFCYFYLLLLTVKDGVVVVVLEEVGLMSVPVEHGCGGGMAEVPSMDTQKRSNSNNDIGLNLKATELRLGLPGSESPERERDGTSVTVEDKNNKNNGFSMLKSMSMVCGAKRGFSDAIDGVSGSGKWVLSGSGGSEVGLGKNGVLFSPSPRGVTAAECTNNQQTPLPAASLVVKETVPHSPKPLHDKKPQTSSAPAAKYYHLPLPPSLFSPFLLAILDMCVCVELDVSFSVE